MLRDICLADAVDADQFVQRRQGGRQLGAIDDFGIDHRKMRLGSASVRAVIEAHFFGQPERMFGHLPAGGTMGFGGLFVNIAKAVLRGLHFAPGPCFAGVDDAILPFHMIPGVDAAFETIIQGTAQDIRAATANVRTRQDRAVEQGGEAVMLDDGSTLDLAQEALAEHPLDRPARVILSKAEQKGGAGLVFFQRIDQSGHTDAGAFQGVDVDFECEILLDRKSTRLNSSHTVISYAVFCLKKKITTYLVLAQTELYV